MRVAVTVGLLLTLAGCATAAEARSSTFSIRAPEVGKEHDAGGGSGFSFSDLLADRAV